MGIGEMDQIRQTVEASSLEKCKEILWNRYGKNYRIIDYRTDTRKGFLHLREHPVTVVTYTETHPQNFNPEYVITSEREEDRDQRSREQILQNNNSILINSQLNQISQLKDGINSSVQQIAEMKEELSRKLQEISSGSGDKHPTIKHIEELLSQNDFSYDFINYIKEKINKEFSLDQLKDSELVERYVVDWIGESISVTQKKVFRPPHVFIIVGPTGVGKTTTLVKLAAQYIKNYVVEHNGEKPQLCFITTDSMRVGAMEQLERWGSHLSTSVYKAERPEDLKMLYDQHRDRVDAVFIDTSGYSPNDSTHIAMVKEVLNVPGMNPDIYLAVMASTKTRDLQNIMQNYELFGYKSVIITKCDESSQFGNIISVLAEKHKEAAYLTHGQIASRDITEASVIEFLKRLEGFRIDRVHIENRFGE